VVVVIAGSVMAVAFWPKPPVPSPTPTATATLRPTETPAATPTATPAAAHAVWRGPGAHRVRVARQRRPERDLSNQQRRFGPEQPDAESGGRLRAHLVAGRREHSVSIVARQSRRQPGPVRDAGRRLERAAPDTEHG
jgi:hypothetical protein